MMKEKIFLSLGVIATVLIFSFLFYKGNTELGIAVLPFLFNQFSFIVLLKKMEEEEVRNEVRKAVRMIKLMTKPKIEPEQS